MSQNYPGERQPHASQPLGFIESTLSTERTVRDVLFDLLEEKYPVGYQGAEDPANDLSRLEMLDALLSSMRGTANPWSSDDARMYQAIVFRSFDFVVDVVELMHGKQPVASLETVVSKLDPASAAGLSDQLVEIGEAYLACRPEVDALVTCFTGSISPSSSYDHILAGFCGMWLMAFDYGYEIQQFNQELDATLEI